MEDMKIKIILAAILTIATLLGVSALVSALNKADHGANHTSSIWHQHQELTQRTAEIRGSARVIET